jgi:transposase
MAVAVAPGQEHETQRFVPLMEEATAWPGQPEKLAGDKAFSAGWIREWLKERGFEPVIAHRKKERGRAGQFDRKAYRRRNIIERCINSLKWFRRVATCYERLATHYLGLVTLAMTMAAGLNNHRGVNYPRITAFFGTYLIDKIRADDAFAKRCLLSLCEDGLLRKDLVGLHGMLDHAWG